MPSFVCALIFSALIVLVAGHYFIPVLRKLKFGQTEYELTLESHKSKTGTPTMGGILFTVSTCVVALIIVLIQNQWYGIWDFLPALLYVSLLNMLIGFVDDYIKIVKKRNLGLIWWQKIIGQVFVAVSFSVYCYLNPYVGSKIIIPFANVEWDLGIFYVPIMSCVLIFMVNSANLQDGVDGILSTVSIIGSTSWAAMALLLILAAGGTLLPELTGNYLHLCVFAFALVGGLMGFLRYNHYPAKVFMGDTGSMFIGGATIGFAMLLRMPVYMILICFTLLASSFSVIIQRIYFKVTHGKRIFKMSPIHHHFELSGMSELQVVAMYAVVTGFLSLIAVLSLRVLP